MTNVIDLYTNDGVRTKAETRHYAGHRFTLRYDPTAAHDQRWLWVAKITRTYEFVGTASTIERAAKAAERKIMEMSNARRAS
jgi:hypothetical protein